MASGGAVLCAAPARSTAAAKDTQLNVYNWSDYIAKDTIPNFTKQTGVQVKYDNYDSDDTLQAKLLTGNSGYDIVVPTSNYAGKQIAAGIFAPLDKSKLPNLKYLDPDADGARRRRRSGQQVHGALGVRHDRPRLQRTKAQQILGKNAALDSWDVLFKPENISKLKACGVSVLDAPDQMFAAALHYIGKDPMSTNPADYREALAMMKKIRPYITQFNSSGYINDMVGGDVCFAYGWSGDVVIAKHRAVEAKKPFKIEYFIPKGGAPVWFDVMAIPKDAKHKEAAHEWINYIETPQVHAAITNAVYYPSANARSAQVRGQGRGERSGRVSAAGSHQDPVPAEAAAAGNPAAADAALDRIQVRPLTWSVFRLNHRSPWSAGGFVRRRDAFRASRVAADYRRSRAGNHE